MTVNVMEALSFSRTLGLFFFFSCEEDAEDEDEELKPMVIQIEVTKKYKVKKICRCLPCRRYYIIRGR